MHVLIIDNQSDNLPELVHACRRNQLTYDVVNSLSTHIEANSRNYDLIILSGGLWYKDPTQQGLHYGEEIEYIRHAQTPVLGICLGMQLLAASYGGELTKLKHQQHGMRTIELTQTGQELLDWTDNFPVYENHTVGVTQAPSPFDILATSEDCIEIMKHEHQPQIGVQFHPEKLHKKEHAQEIWHSLFKLLLTDYSL